MKWKLINAAVFAILILFMVGCTTTIMFEDEYDVRIVNRTGDSVKVRFDDDISGHIVIYLLSSTGEVTEGHCRR